MSVTVCGVHVENCKCVRVCACVFRLFLLFRLFRLFLSFLLSIIKYNDDGPKPHMRHTTHDRREATGGAKMASPTNKREGMQMSNADGWQVFGNYKMVDPDGQTLVKVVGFPSAVGTESMWVVVVEGDENNVPVPTFFRSCAVRRGPVAADQLRREQQREDRIEPSSFRCVIHRGTVKLGNTITTDQDLPTCYGYASLGGGSTVDRVIAAAANRKNTGSIAIL